MSFSKTAAGQKGVERALAKQAMPTPIRFLTEAREKVYKKEIKDLPKFRSSSLPYCGILYMRDTLEVYVNGPIEVEKRYHDEFYTTIGTAMHLLWQEILSVPNALVRPYGSWKNKETGEHIFDAFRPVDGDWTYDEIEMEYEGLSCHIDFVGYVPASKGEEPYWFLADLKTAMTKMIEKPDEHIPVIKNIFQIEAYMCIFEEVFGIRPKYYVLDYQAREKSNSFHPHLIEWTDAKRNAAFRRLDAWVENHKAARKTLSKLKPMLNKASPCKTPSEQPYSVAMAVSALEPVVATRPCHTKDQYDRIMAPALYYEGGCRHAKLCTNQTGQRLVLSLLDAIKPAEKPSS